MKKIRVLYVLFSTIIIIALSIILVDNYKIISQLEKENTLFEEELLEVKKDNAKRLDEKQEIIKDLEDASKTYKKKENLQMNLDRVFPSISSFVSEFYMFKNEGDIDKINSLLEGDLVVYEDEDIILKKNETEEYILFDRTRGFEYRRMAILGIGYIEDEDAYSIHTQQFIYYEDGSPFEHASFINFIIKWKSDGGGWSIIDISFDI
ncbi:hypothetical protein [Vallitalea okinawensis]|uniref:hypothetical protein n=1 Tax=Vallitalea okinawensis TaxID=2078660 RepID=UPI000CFC438C|nr:hypothetical protein [Vallitalea okinawensis]